jgi:hypothetical protein
VFSHANPQYETAGEPDLPDVRGRAPRINSDYAMEWAKA